MPEPLRATKQQKTPEPSRSQPSSDSQIWPTLDIKLTTKRLTLRPVWGPDVFEVSRTAALGIHDSRVIPFLTDWATANSPSMEREVARFIWQNLANQTPESWTLYFGVWCDSTLIGAQDVGAMNFSQLLEVHTGSWLAKAWQGQGYGKEMRIAVLDLAFYGLGAMSARSAAREDNPASLRVAESLGYRRDGTGRSLFGDQPATEIRLLIDRSDWLARDHVQTEIEGVTPEVLAVLGADVKEPDPKGPGSDVS